MVSARFPAIFCHAGPNTLMFLAEFSRIVIYKFTDPKFEKYIAASTEATLIIDERVVTQSQRSLSNDFLTSGFFLTMLVFAPGARSSPLLWQISL